MEEILDSLIPENFTENLVQHGRNVAIAILVVFIGIRVIKWLMTRVKTLMTKRHIDKDLQPFLVSIFDAICKIGLALVIANIVDIKTTSFVAIFGALTFAIGMALQGSLGHFAAGVLILLFKPYRTGDLVTIQGHTGVVDQIQIFNTILRTPDNKRIILPNGTVTNGAITNITGQGEMKVVMSFGISYNDNIDKARTVIQQVADACPHIMHEKPVDIFVEELAGSSVNFAVRPWVKCEHYWDVYFYMQENIKKEFDKAGISIPFNTMDMNIVSQA